jgi:glutaredoxin
MFKSTEFEMKSDALRWLQRWLRVFLLAGIATVSAAPAMAQMQPAASPGASTASAAARQQLVEVFVREGCPHCAKAEEFLDRLAKERPDIRIVIRDVVKEPAALQRLQEVARQQSTGNARVPAFFVGGQLIFGYSEEASTDKLIRGALQGQKAQPGAAAAEGLSCAAQEASTCKLEEEAKPADGFEVTLLGRTISLDDVGLPAFTVAMGLLDGLNPCSMWVLILMISLLATLNDRKRMLAIAGTFVLVEGIAYFVFMAAWLNLFLLIGLSRASQIAIAAIAIVAGVINMKDFWAPGWGVSLSISDKSKPGIYARMRNILQAKSLPAAIIGVIVLGLLVQVVEFLCTSGFPALFTRILTMRELDTASYYGYLLLYIAAYMLDDVIVLAIGVTTLSHRRLQDKEGRWLKLISGVVMVGLGIYLILAG